MWMAMGSHGGWTSIRRAAGSEAGGTPTRASALREFVQQLARVLHVGRVRALVRDEAFERALRAGLVALVRQRLAQAMVDRQLVGAVQRGGLLEHADRLVLVAQRGLDATHAVVAQRVLRPVALQRIEDLAGLLRLLGPHQVGAELAPGLPDGELQRQVVTRLDGAQLAFF